MPRLIQSLMQKKKRKKRASSGVHYRSLVHTIEETFSSEQAKAFHWHPFEEHWQPPWDGATLERIHGELFTSKAFLDADRELQNSPPEPGCTLPRVIAAMMSWSDATHVAQFGQAKLWPLYELFGNQSKYDRARPSMRAAHHAAYFPSVREIIGGSLSLLLILFYQLPDDIQDYMRKHGRAASTQMFMTVQMHF